MRKQESHEKGKYLATDAIIEGLVGKALTYVGRAKNPVNGQYEAEDDNGNRIIYVKRQDGTLARPIQVLDARDNVLAKSTDGINWQIGHYEEPGIDFVVENSNDVLDKVQNATRVRSSVRRVAEHPDMDQRAA
jgi:hypothetical protein